MLSFFRRRASVRRRFLRGPRPYRPIVEPLEARQLLATITWDGGGPSDDWNDPTNWDTDTVPGSADDALIPQAITITSSANASVNRITSNSRITINGGTFTILGDASINASNAVNINGAGTLVLDTMTLSGSGALNNNATLELRGSAISKAVSNNGLLLTRAIGGTSTISGALTTTASSILRVEADHNESSATLSVTATAGLTNNGLIDLTQIGGNNPLTATLNVSRGTLINAAGKTIRAAAGTGGLRALDAQIVNNGIIDVDAPLSVSNFERTFTSIGGTLDIAAGQTLSITSGTTLLGSGTQLPGAGTLELAGNTHAVNLLANCALPAGGTALRTSGQVTINGPGSLSNGSLVEVQSGLLDILAPVAQLSGTTLTGGSWAVQANSTLNLPGSGIATNQANITLSGANSHFPDIDGLAANSASLTITGGRSFFTAGPLANSGSVTIGPLSTLGTLAGDYVQNAGSTRLEAATSALDPAGLVNIQGGTLAGVGTILGNLLNQSLVAPGLPAGTLNVVGDYQQTVAGALAIDLATASSFDQLALSGAATLAGALNVSLLGGFVPPPGAVFPILPAASRTGTFTNLTGLQISPGRFLAAVHHTAGVRLAADSVEAGNDAAVSEGQSFNLLATFLDPGASDDYTASVNWGDGSSPQPLMVDHLANTAAGQHIFGDDGVFTVTVTLTSGGLTATDSLQVTASNAPPMLVPIANQNVALGAAFNLSAAFSDPGFGAPGPPASSESFTFSIDWGDGTPNSSGSVTAVQAGAPGVPTTGAINANHAYLSPGIFTIIVSVRDDDGGMDSEQFLVTVLPPPTVSIASVVRAEGNTGLTPFEFTVRLSHPSSQTASVRLFTLDATATTADADYVAAEQLITFAPGEMVQSATVYVPGDYFAELDESFLVALVKPVNATVIGAPTALSSFNIGGPAAGIALDPVSGNLFVRQSGQLRELTPAGSPVLPDISAPGADGSNFDLDHLSEPLNLGGTPIAAGALLAMDGNRTPNRIHALDKDTGGVLASVDLSLTGIVGGSYHAGRDTFFVLTAAGLVAEIQPASGTTLASFPASPPGSPAFGTAFGDVEVDQTTGNVLIVGSGQGVIREMTPGGVFLRDINVAPLVVGGVAGIALDDAQRQAWVLDTSDQVTRIALPVSTAAGVIQNDDVARFSIAPLSLSAAEGQAGSAELVFNVSVQMPVKTPVEVRVQTQDGAAAAGEDYLPLNQVLTFSPGGPLSQQINVTFTGDTLAEADEMFSVVLRQPTGPAALGEASAAQATILNDDFLHITIDDAQILEGDAGTQQLTLSVHLAADSLLPVTIQVDTADDTAASPGDYLPLVNHVLSFEPGGPRTQLVSVPVVGDLTSELLERFLVNLSSAGGGGVIADGQAVGTIHDNDAQPVLSIGDAQVVEGGSGTAELAFTVSLSHPSSQPISLQFAIADGTALAADDDYEPTSGALNFPANSVQPQTIVVLVSGDTKFEADQMLLVNLHSPVNAVIAGSQGLGTIVNDDLRPTISLSGAPVQVEGDSGTFADAAFGLSLSHASDEAVSVQFSTADGTASATDGDYDAVAGRTIAFTPGGPLTKQTFVRIRGDDVHEGDETFLVSLSSPINGTLAVASSAATILDDESQPVLTIGDVSIGEGDSGIQQFVFTVSLSGASSQPVTVDVATQDGTATVADNDYQPLAPQTLTFAPGGPLQQQVVVQVNGDVKFEADQTFSVLLSNPTNAAIADGVGLGTILNNDSRPSLMILDRAVSETNAGSMEVLFDVALSHPSDETITVAVSTSDAAASVADGDYVAVADRVLTFAPGVMLQQTTVEVLGDTRFEADQAFIASLASPTNASIARGQAIGTILNDDSRPVVVIAGVSAIEGDALVFSLALTNRSDEAVSVLASTASGTASLADNDYLPVMSRLVGFAPGVLTAQLVVETIQDDKFEEDQTLTVVLSGPTNAGGVVGSPASGTILNNDLRPTIRIAGRSVPEGNAPFDLLVDVTLSHSTDETISVQVDTADGTASVADGDYEPVVGRIVAFAPGVLQQQTAVRIVGDAAFEPDESLFVNLSNAVNVESIAEGQALITLLNDDAPPPVNQPPMITSGGGGDTAAVMVSENTTDVMVVAAVDSDAGPQSLVFRITGGADAALFTIDLLSGALRFAEPPDFEQPADAGGDNTYDVTVEITDGEQADSQAIAVTITDVAESIDLIAIGADASPRGRPVVKLFDGGGNLLSSFLAYAANFRGGVRVAVGDVTGDGVPEIVTAPGRGHAPLVKVFDLAGQEHAEYRIQTYAATFKGGVNVAIGDVVGDARSDIVVVPGRGQAQVRVFENVSAGGADPFADAPARQFLAFAGSFRGGASVALADMNADGKDEIVVGSGSGMRATVNVFDVQAAAASYTPTAQFLPFGPRFRGGVFIAAGRVDGDLVPELIVGAGTGGSLVEIHSGAGGGLLNSVAPLPPAHRGGVRVAAKDFDGDGLIDTVFAAPGGRAGSVRRFAPLSAAAVDFLFESGLDFRGGFQLG